MIRFVMLARSFYRAFEPFPHHRRLRVFICRLDHSVHVCDCRLIGFFLVQNEFRKITFPSGNQLDDLLELFCINGHHIRKRHGNHVVVVLICHIMQLMQSDPRAIRAFVKIVKFQSYCIRKDTDQQKVAVV